jgi:hypothetical protein
VVWRGKDQTKKDETTGWQEDRQVDWTRLDWTGQAQDRTRGRETRTSKVEEIETDTQDQTDQIDRQTAEEEQSTHAHTHTHTHHLR